MKVKKPFVRIFYCRPNIGENSGNSYSLFNITHDGKNIGSENFLESFRYSYETSGADSAEVSLAFKNTNIDLAIFKNGVRLALVFGYDGLNQTVRDVVIEKVKGRLTSNGYSITLSLIPSIAYADRYSYEGDLGEQLSQMGAYMEYTYYNARTGTYTTLKYYPGDNSMMVNGVVKEYFKKDKKPASEYSNEALRTTETNWRAFSAGGTAKNWYPNYKSPGDGGLKHLKESVKDAMMRVLHGFIKVPDSVQRDDKQVFIPNPEDAPSIRAYSAGPSTKFPRCISFSFSAGDKNKSDDEEAELEIEALDLSTKEKGGINIAKDWKISNPETGAFEKFTVVKKEEDYYYTFEDGTDLALKPSEVLRLKKIQLQENFNQYKHGLRPQDINPDAEYQRGYRDDNKPTAREILASSDAESQTLGGVSNYMNTPAKDLMDQLFKRDGGQRIFTEGMAKNFVKRSKINGFSYEQLLGKAIKSKMDAILSNITCELTVEGDPALESAFNFVVANAGRSISGKYHATKVVHQISSGKYTMTISGNLIPDTPVSLIVKKEMEGLESSINELELRQKVYDKLSVAMSLSLAPYSPSSMAELLGTYGLSYINIGVKREDSPVKIQGKTTTHRLIAESPEELDQMLSDSKTRTQMGVFEISADQLINKNAELHNTQIIGNLEKQSRRSIKNEGLIVPSGNLQETFTTVPVDFFKNPNNEP